MENLNKCRHLEIRLEDRNGVLWFRCPKCWKELKYVDEHEVNMIHDIDKMPIIPDIIIYPLRMKFMVELYKSKQAKEIEAAGHRISFSSKEISEFDINHMIYNINYGIEIENHNFNWFINTKGRIIDFFRIEITLPNENINCRVGCFIW